MSGDAHKFKVGEQVKLYRSLRGTPVEGLLYEVTRLMPAENNEFQYRIRTVDGRTDRVALESQLLQTAATQASAAFKPPLNSEQG